MDPGTRATLAEESVDAIMYHSGDSAWKPLALTRVSNRLKSSLSVVHIPQTGDSSPSPANARLSWTRHRFLNSRPWDALEGELGDVRGLVNFVSGSGVVRIQLVIRDGQLGTPSLILEGVVRE